MKNTVSMGLLLLTDKYRFEKEARQVVTKNTVAAQQPSSRFYVSNAEQVRILCCLIFNTYFQVSPSSALREQAYQEPHGQLGEGHGEDGGGGYG